MKKYFLFLLVAVIGVLTSCQEDAPVMGGDGLVSISVSAPQQGLTTRSGSSEFGQPALSNMRVALIISTEDNKVIDVVTKTHDFTQQSACTFDVKLYQDKTYNISAWADYGENYYTIPTKPTTTNKEEQPAPVVKMNTTITGSNSQNDAYFGNITKVISANEKITLQLARPFALVKVNTTDWNEPAVKLSGYRPDSYSTIFYAPTQLNLVSGVASDTADITVTAPIVTYDKDSTMKELHYDYLFAGTTSSILKDFTVSYLQNGTQNAAYTFTNIPVQRNYQTNITGNILTKRGQLSVKLDSIDWATTVYQQDVNDIEGANDVIAQNAAAGKKNIDINFKSQPNDAGEPGDVSAAGDTARAILTTPLSEGSTLNINVESETKSLYVGDYVTETSTTVQTEDVNAAIVNINVPTNSKIETLVINAPSKTVYVNGKLVSNVGVIDHIDAITSMNTLIVAADQHVKKLTMRQGGLEIHGVVDTVEIPEGHGDIKVRDCEGLSQAVYDVLEPYIDVDNGYVGALESGKSTYRIYVGMEPVAKIGEKKYYNLVNAFESASDDEEIVLLKDVDVNEVIAVVRSFTLNIGDKNINFSGDAIDEEQGAFQVIGTAANPPTFTIKGTTGIIHSTYGCINIYTNGCGFVLESGTITADKGCPVQTYDGNIVCSDDYSSASWGGYSGNKSITIKGGKVSTQGTESTNGLIHIGGALLENSHNHLIVTGGVFESQTDEFSAFYIANNCIASIKNCQINGSKSGRGVFLTSNATATLEGVTMNQMESLFNLSETSSMEVLSGQYSVDANAHTPISVASGASLAIKGGTYNADPSNWVADGYMAVSNGGTPETWTVKATTPANASTSSFGDWK